MGNKTRLRLIGGLTGFLSAGFGIGGGALLVPAYHSLAGFSFKEAAGNSLATIVPIVAVGLVGRVWFHPNLDYHQIHYLFILAVMSGGFAASRFIGKLTNGNGIKALFGIFLILCGLRLAHGMNVISLMLPVSCETHSVLGVLFATGFGVLVGAVAAILGVGCGLAIVPFFVIVFDYPIGQAIFQSLLTMLVLSSFNAFVYKQVGKTNLSGAKTAILPALVGACGGLYISTQLNPALMKFLFGYLLMIIGLRYTYLCVQKLIKEYYVCSQLSD